MVLSNKKLKEKLRAAKAELIVASEAQNKAGKNSESSQGLDSKTPYSLKTILNPEAQNPKLAKKEKLRQKGQKTNSGIINSRETGDDVVEKKEDGLKLDAVEVKKKKRKRDESETSENVMEKKPQQLKKKKNTKKKQKSKKKVGDGKVKEEGVEQNGSGAPGEKLVAKTDENIERKYVEASPRVYVGGIPYYSTEDDIRSYFEGCGTITCVDCMTFPDTGKFRGIAIITFKTEAAAKRALALDGSDMGGLFLKIQPFKSARVNKLSNFSPSVLEGYNRIYIGNLSWDVTENDLRKLFADCTVSSIRFGEDKETGEFKGYAHVDFADSLSLNMALKLDQTIFCGRPVRISCAVPKKGTTTNLKPMPNDNQVDSGNFSAVNENQGTSSEADVVSSKVRMQSCYECGERGHLSSSCPKKQADLSSSFQEKQAGLSSSFPGKQADLSLSFPEKQTDLSLSFPEKQANVVSSKLRRRSCYECGERGHLSSSCLKKQADLSSSFPEKQTDLSLSFPEKQADLTSSEANVVSSKVRRRSCYECGERGHLSSSCPKKQADLSSSFPEKQADLSSPFPEKQADLSSPFPEKQADLSSSWPKKQADDWTSPYVVNENQVTNSGASALSSKIRRRTCYECGERGHLSSSCPKKQADDSSNPGAT